MMRAGCGLLLGFAISSTAWATGQGPAESTVELDLQPSPIAIEDFLAGQPGIVGKTQWRRWRALSYRLLSGVPLTHASRVSFTPPVVAFEKSPAQAWIKLRAKVEPKPPAHVEYDFWEGCLDDAFATAIKTLHQRAARFGDNSNEVRDWVVAQDAVFTNCGPSDKSLMPNDKIAAGVDASLQRDRDYQIAAALFYRGKYVEARNAFDRIAFDKTSPWASYAQLAAARTLLREGTAQKYSDSALLDEAQRRLELIIADPKLAALHRSARRLERYGAFNGHRDPQFYALTEMLERANDPDLALAAIDFGRLIDPVTVEQRADVAAWEARSDLIAWTLAWDLPDGERLAYAKQRWAQKKSRAWLLVALSDASPKQTALIEAARAIQSGPGYVTAGAERARLLLVEKRYAAARTLLDELLSTPKLPSDTANFLRAKRFDAAADLDDAMKYAVRTSQATTPMLTLRAQMMLWRVLPVGETLAAIRHPAIPDSIKTRLLHIAWVRAAVSDDLETARGLDDNTDPQAKWRAAPTANDRAIELALAWQAHPDWETDPLDYWDLYDVPNPIVPPQFVDAALAKRGNAEWQQFRTAIINASSWRANQISAWAVAHTDDPRMPQALCRAVKQTRNHEASAASKRAYLTLHKLYPKSPWAKRCQYWF